jgi:transposase
MKRKRRTHSPEFKARVAMEALKGIKPIHEIAADNEIHPVQVSRWKRELQERMSEVFERKNAVSKEAKADEQRSKQPKRSSRSKHLRQQAITARFSGLRTQSQKSLCGYVDSAASQVGLPLRPPHPRRTRQSWGFHKHRAPQS